MAQLRTRHLPDDDWGDGPFDAGDGFADGGGNASAANRLSARLGLTGRASVIVAACVVVAILGGVGFARARQDDSLFVIDRVEAVDSEQSAPDEAHDQIPSPTAENPTVEAETVVHVDGAVASPGVYRLTMDAPRVGDAVEAAGGLLADADTSVINLAEPLADGSKVHIYRLDETASFSDAPTDPTASAGTLNPIASPGLVNVNTANREQLETLPGIGEATANAIIADRERNGSFGAVDELTRVDGIGEKKLAKIRDLVCV